MTDAPHDGPPLGEPIRFGHYLIHELLGVGGMAEVYRGSVEGAESFRKPVVIKRVKPEHAESQHHVEMFIDEARINAHLEHANIVSVSDFGETDGHYYLAMEFIDGLNLQLLHVRHKVATSQPLPWQASLIIVRDVLRGLDYAHRMLDEQGHPLGIVHRDVSLVNIMVRRDGAVKLLDFGCAKASQQIRTTETMAGIIKGKVAYMSPEQTMNKPLDGRTDVFAASIVLHELLTGRRLFHGADELEMLRAVRNKEIPDPRMYARDVPESLARVTLKGLARELDQRYGSAQEMADALEDIAHEHRIPGTLLRDLMGQLMADDVPPQQRAVSAKHQHITAKTWKHQSVDEIPKTPWSLMGAIPAPPAEPEGAAPDAGTAAEDDAPTLERAPVLISVPDWLLRDAPSVEPKPSPMSGEANPWLAPPSAGVDDEAWMDADAPASPDDAPPTQTAIRRASSASIPPWLLWAVLAALVAAGGVFLLLTFG